MVFPLASENFDDYVATPTASTVIRSWTVPLLGTGIYLFEWYLSSQPGGGVEITVNGNTVFTPETTNVQHDFQFNLSLIVGDVVDIKTTATVNTSYPVESDLVITQIG